MIFKIRFFSSSLRPPIRSHWEWRAKRWQTTNQRRWSQINNNVWLDFSFDVFGKIIFFFFLKKKKIMIHATQLVERKGTAAAASKIALYLIKTEPLFACFKTQLISSRVARCPLPLLWFVIYNLLFLFSLVGSFLAMVCKCVCMGCVFAIRLLKVA